MTIMKQIANACQNAHNNAYKWNVHQLKKGIGYEMKVNYLDGVTYTVEYDEDISVVFVYDMNTDERKGIYTVGAEKWDDARTVDSALIMGIKRAVVAFNYEY